MVKEWPTMGERVMVTMEWGMDHVGTVSHYTDDRLWLRVDGRSRVVGIPTDSVAGWVFVR